MKEQIEKTVKTALLLSEGWLVGGAINSILNNEPLKDYDIIVPNRELFQLTCAHFNEIFGSPYINSNGGLKFKGESIEIDVWCEELSHFLVAAKRVDYIYNLKRDLLLKIVQSPPKNKD